MNTIQIVIQGVDQFSRTFDSVIGGLDNVGRSLTRTGAQLTAATAPFTAALGVAVNQAVQFDEAMTNVGAVLGRNREQMAALSDEVLAIGGRARAGPQAVAEAMYDIVGGVADASTHMAILEQAVATSEAGAAELSGTTSALISIMNAYTFSADQAGFASDTLTRLVGAGVGTMDEFASALPRVATVAAQTGVEFDDLSAMMAFLTTKGASATESATYLRQAIVGLLNPNAAMQRLLQQAGMESGSAALRMYGLAGVMGRLEQVTGGSVDAMAEAVGSVEALQAVMAINQPQFEEFLTTFKDGIASSTDIARAIQRQSPAFQFDLLKSSLSELGITIGEAVLPALNGIINAVRPIIQSISAFARANPQLTQTLVGVVVGLTGAGVAMTALGFATSGLGSVLGVVTTLFGALLSPVGLVVAAVAGLAALLGVDVVGGFQAIIQQGGVFVARFQEFGGDIGRTLSSMFNVEEDGSSFFSTILEGFGMTRDQAQSIGASISETVNNVITTVQSVLSTLPFYVEYYLGALWEKVRPILEPLAAWFTDSLLPAISNTFENHVLPLLKRFQDFLGGIWKVVQPHLERLYNWFVEDGLPAITDFIDTKVIPGVDTFIDLIAAVWDVVGPALTKFADWFLNSALPAVVDFFKTRVMPIFNAFITLVSNLWDVISPPLKKMADWFLNSGLPVIVSRIEAAIGQSGCSPKRWAIPSARLRRRSVENPARPKANCRGERRAKPECSTAPARSADQGRPLSTQEQPLADAHCRPATAVGGGRLACRISSVVGHSPRSSSPKRRDVSIRAGVWAAART